MTTYNDLTTEQKTLLNDFINNARALAGEIAKTCNHIDAAVTGYNAGVDDVIAALDNGAVIPNTSGLSGAQALAKEDIVAFMTAIATVNGGYNTSANREQWAQFAGATNLVG